MMKKILLATVMVVCLGAVTVQAAQPILTNNRRGANSGECSYSPLQDLVRNARSGKDLAPIVGGRVDLNAPVRCGGTVLQLAIRRGNSEIVKLLLENGASFKENVSLDGFDINGAPNEIPLLSFAAYYAPRQDIVSLIISAGADITQTDANGENILWYIEKNPVLQNTAIHDSIKNALLFGVPKQVNSDSVSPVAPATGKGGAAAVGTTPSDIGSTAGNVMPQNLQPVILSKQPDGSVGIPPEVMQAIGATAQPAGQIPIEIVEPNRPIQ